MVMPQRKVGGVVIENPLVPSLHRVASVTLLTIFPGVHICRLMAANASRLFKLVALAGVAAAAGHLSMAAVQIKAGGGVIKLLTLLPTVGRMAGSTLGAERAFMEVVLLVTAGAHRFGVTKLRAFCVAAGTGEGGVFALQREASPLVAEGVDGDRDDIGIAAQVIGMTCVTRLDARLGRLAVKTGFTVAVRANVVVAVQTQVGHGGFVEGRVALIALGFEFRVAGDHIPRQQCALLDGHFLRPGGPTDPAEEKAESKQPRGTFHQGIHHYI